VAISVFDPRGAKVLKHLRREQTLDQYEVDPKGQWLSLMWVHQVICFLCECRAWDSERGLKGDTPFPKLEIRAVYEREVDDYASGQRFKAIMFGLGCPDNNVDSVKEVWRRRSLWQWNMLCWDYTEYGEKLAEVQGHALKLKSMHDKRFALHRKAIATPIEGETFGDGFILDLIKERQGNGGKVKIAGVIDIKDV